MQSRSFLGRRRAAAVAAALVLSQLAACGDGGSGGSDDDGDGPPPPPATVALTFKGVVTDAPIANAAVTLLVGNRSFTATADANGAYTVTAEVEQSEAGGFVTLQAKGAGAQSFVEFTSLAGAFASLVNAAGDGTLTSDESFATQITNVSTAEAALLVQANGGAPITTEERLTELGGNLDGAAVLDLATAIKLAVDDAANYPLPEGVSTLGELLADAETREQFVVAAAEQSPETFQQTQTAIATDPTLTQPLSAAELPDNITAALLSDAAGFTFNFIDRVSSYDFDEGGAGYLAEGSHNTDFSWTVEGSTVLLSYAEPVEVLSYDIQQCGDVVRQVEALYTTSGATLSLLSDRTLAVTQTSQVTYFGCDTLPNREVTFTEARTMLRAEDLDSLTSADISGTTQTFYVYNAAQKQVQAEIADVAADGSGMTRLSGLGFSWSVDEQGAIVVAFSDGSSGRYARLREVDAFVDDLVYELDTADGRFIDAGPSIDVDPAYAVTAIDAADVPGRYYQFGIGNEQAPAEGVKGFRLRFDVDGTGAQEDDALVEGSVETYDEHYDPAVQLRWSVEEDSQIVVRRTFDTQTQTYNCLAGSANCLLWDERRILPLVESDDGRFYVIEVRRMDNYFGVSAQTPYTVLARFYDFEPLGADKALPVAATKAAKLRGTTRH